MWQLGIAVLRSVAWMTASAGLAADVTGTGKAQISVVFRVSVDVRPVRQRGGP